MKDKKPQFKSKSLPGLSKEELNKMTQRSLVNSDNAKLVDREKLGKILSESYKSNPKMQDKMKENGVNTCAKLKARGYYESKEYLDMMKSNGNKHIESGHWGKVRKVGTKSSVKSRIKKGKERKLRVLEKIPFGVEFQISKDLKPICIELNEVHKYWNKIVSDPDLVKKVYKGTSKTDPPRYIRIK